jgi:hypothetical protein
MAAEVIREGCKRGEDRYGKPRLNLTRTRQQLFAYLCRQARGALIVALVGASSKYISSVELRKIVGNR